MVLFVKYVSLYCSYSLIHYFLFQIVLFLPALCRKMGVPYCIIKGKSRLGRLVRRKTCTAVALVQVKFFLYYLYYFYIIFLSYFYKNNNSKHDEFKKSQSNDNISDITKQYVTDIILLVLLNFKLDLLLVIHCFLF